VSTRSLIVALFATMLAAQEMDRPQASSTGRMVGSIDCPRVSDPDLTSAKDAACKTMQSCYDEGKLFYTSKRYSDAIASLLKALRLAPQTAQRNPDTVADTHHVLAKAYYNLPDDVRATRHACEATGQLWNGPEFQLTLARIAYRRGLRELAAHAAQKCLERAPPSAEAKQCTEIKDKARLGLQRPPPGTP
jgi:tetratricopeptide (TPR) repeat protein